MAAKEAACELRVPFYSTTSQGTKNPSTDWSSFLRHKFANDIVFLQRRKTLLSAAVALKGDLPIDPVAEPVGTWATPQPASKSVNAGTPAAYSCAAAPLKAVVQTLVVLTCFVLQKTRRFC